MILQAMVRVTLQVMVQAKLQMRPQVALSVIVVMVHASVNERVPGY